jgi:hypothetical protein
LLEVGLEAGFGAAFEVENATILADARLKRTSI